FTLRWGSNPSSKLPIGGWFEARYELGEDRRPLCGIGNALEVTSEDRERPGIPGASFQVEPTTHDPERTRQRVWSDVVAAIVQDDRCLVREPVGRVHPVSPEIGAIEEDHLAVPELGDL